MIESILKDIEELKKRTTRPLVTAGINMVLEIIKKHSKNNGWIPCSERLPEVWTECLISYYNTNEGKNLVDIAYLKDDGEWEMFREKGGYFPYNFKKKITHWQPLPEAYHG